MIAATLQLLDAYGPAVLRDAVSEMIARGAEDRGAMATIDPPPWKPTR